MVEIETTNRSDKIWKAYSNLIQLVSIHKSVNHSESCTRPTNWSPYPAQWTSVVLNKTKLCLIKTLISHFGSNPPPKNNWTSLGPIVCYGIETRTLANDIICLRAKYIWKKSDRENVFGEGKWRILCLRTRADFGQWKYREIRRKFVQDQIRLNRSPLWLRSNAISGVPEQQFSP